MSDEPFNKPRILITNDDGVFSPGLAILAIAASETGEVNIVAPAKPQSGMAHSLTIRKPLVAKLLQLQENHNLHITSIDGTPADCVRLALKNILEHKPDLVLSGLNIGANVGINANYSGTVAAAAEGAIRRIPAIALSADIASPEQMKANFQQLVSTCRSVLTRLLPTVLKQGGLLNVNIPLRNGKGPVSMVACELSDAAIEDNYTKNQIDDGCDQYTLQGSYDFIDPHPQSDVALLRDGNITITPVTTARTDHQLLKDMKKDLESRNDNGIVD